MSKVHDNLKAGLSPFPNKRVVRYDVVTASDGLFSWPGWQKLGGHPYMQDQAKAIGESFKLRRKEMNLSLKEVENSTSIRTNYLQFIEEGEFGSLISPVHAQGFVKQYAVFLGMDGERLVQENPKLFFLSGNYPQGAYRQDFAYGIGTMESRNPSGGGVKWLPNLLWVAVSLAVLGGAWLLAKYLGVL